MGCMQSRPEGADGRNESTRGDSNNESTLKEFKNYKWTSEKLMTLEDVQKERQIFWETEPSYYGKKEVWDAIKKICESKDLMEAQKMAISVPLKFHTGHIKDGCYDNSGIFYQIPSYCFALPENLVSNEVKKQNETKLTEIDGGSQLSEATDLTIRIRLTTAEDINLNVAINDTLNNVLQRLSLVKGWGKDEQPLPKVRFIYLGKILSLSSTLSQLKITNDAVVQAQVTFN
ncbi:hypothetical protein K502DRAFT_340518 [Neoconidiobolus thromboides FSU 785]|nr:hypothetical protein K502DRAFT_340518 [Neoconidiobolus thromboides FSU 785]